MLPVASWTLRNASAVTLGRGSMFFSGSVALYSAAHDVKRPTT